jgi:hypothetical protein
MDFGFSATPESLATLAFRAGSGALAGTVGRWSKRDDDGPA